MSFRVRCPPPPPVPYPVPVSCRVAATVYRPFLMVVAITPFSFFGQTLYWLWSPVVRFLPKSWWEDWIV